MVLSEGLCLLLIHFECGHWTQQWSQCKGREEKLCYGSRLVRLFRQLCWLKTHSLKEKLPEPQVQLRDIS